MKYHYQCRYYSSIDCMMLFITKLYFPGLQFRGLSTPESPLRWGRIRIQIWQYIPMYPAIVPIYALFSDTLGFLGSDLSGSSPLPPYVVSNTNLLLLSSLRLCWNNWIDEREVVHRQTLTLNQFLNALSIGGGLVESVLSIETGHIYFSLIYVTQISSVLILLSVVYVLGLLNWYIRIQMLVSRQYNQYIRF